MIRSLRLVIGYVPGADRTPRAAQDAGLARRVGLVLHAEAPAAVEPRFDFETYLVAAEQVMKSLAADELELPDGAREDLERFARRLSLVPEAEREPFEQFTFLRRGVTVGLMAFEPWVRVGGPAPYHDEYVVGVYTREDISADLEQGLRTSTVLGAPNVEVRRYPEEPDGGRLAALVERVFRRR